MDWLMRELFAQEAQRLVQQAREEEASRSPPTQAQSAAWDAVEERTKQAFTSQPHGFDNVHTNTHKAPSSYQYVRSHDGLPPDDLGDRLQWVKQPVPKATRTGQQSQQSASSQASAQVPQTSSHGTSNLHAYGIARDSRTSEGGLGTSNWQHGFYNAAGSAAAGASGLGSGSGDNNYDGRYPGPSHQQFARKD